MRLHAWYACQIDVVFSEEEKDIVENDVGKMSFGRDGIRLQPILLPEYTGRPMPKGLGMFDRGLLYRGSMSGSRSNCLSAVCDECNKSFPLWPYCHAGNAGVNFCYCGNGKHLIMASREEENYVRPRSSRNSRRMCMCMCMCIPIHIHPCHPRHPRHP